MLTRLPLAALGLLLLSPVAFWPSYVSRLGAADGLRHVHAALGMSWLVLLVVQPLLIRSKVRTWHRRLGWGAVLIGAAFGLSGFALAHGSLVAMNAEQFAREGRLVYLPLAMALIYCTALGLALWWRATPPVHARFMAATALPLLDPLFARLLFQHAPPLPFDKLYPLPAFATMMLVLVAMLHSLPARAPGRGALRMFTWGVAIALGGFVVVPETGLWQRFVEGLRQWPGA